METIGITQEKYSDIAEVASAAEGNIKPYKKLPKRNLWFGPRSWRRYYTNNYIVPMAIGLLFVTTAGSVIGAGGYFLKQGAGNRYFPESKIINTADGEKITDDSATAARAKSSLLEQ